jgi:hypothetical protein
MLWCPLYKKMLWCDVCPPHRCSGAGGHKEMSSILADQWYSSYMTQMWVEGRRCGVSYNDYSCAHGVQINFGDLTQYLTYALVVWGPSVYCIRRGFVSSLYRKPLWLCVPSEQILLCCVCTLYQCCGVVVM